MYNNPVSIEIVQITHGKLKRMYQKIRNVIKKNETAFKFARFFFTPVRLTKEYFIRRKMAIALITKYSNLSADQKKIYYFGIPEHNNLGDIAQTYCTKQWVNENYPNRVLIEAKTRTTFDSRFLTFVKEKWNDDDIILFQSGYCTRTKNPDHLMHLNIAKKFPNAKMVILPQTVKLSDPSDIKKTRDIFDKCKKLKFITRDKLSYKFAREFVSDERLECYPDIVTSLIGRVSTNGVRKGVLLCVRNDDEKYYTDQEISHLKKALSICFSRVDITDTNSTKGAEEVFNNLEEEINIKLKQFSSYECVITDRYHGTIFSLVSNTPVIVIKTNDHKVTSSIEWFKGVFNQYSVQFADNLDDAYLKASYISKNKINVINNDELYNKYYKERLKSLVSSL